MNRREFLQINLAGALVAVTGLPALDREPALMSLHLYQWDYVPTPSTALATLMEAEVDTPRVYHPAIITDRSKIVTFALHGTARICGAYVKSGSRLVLAKRFPWNRDVTAGDQLEIHMGGILG